MDERTEKYWIRIQPQELDVGAATEFLRTEEAGGVNVFLGTTRRWTDGRETVRLHYESYGSMALKEMKALVAEAASHWPVKRACIIHREGEVPLGEISVIIGAAAPHRDEAYEASRFLIDELKTRVPIWKRERYADGTSEWVEGTLPEHESDEAP